jgi:probable rRNA maturation factor
LLQAARHILRDEGASRGEVSILLTDDLTIHHMNRQYRNQDKPTDVLSFCQRESDHGVLNLPANSGSPEILGDVIISVETAERQAHQNGLCVAEELAMLTVHGILHLLGYEDETEGGAELMRLKECSALNTLGIRHRRAIESDTV